MLAAVPRVLDLMRGWLGAEFLGFRKALPPLAGSPSGNGGGASALCIAAWG